MEDGDDEDYEHTLYFTAEEVRSSEFQVRNIYGQPLYKVPVIVADGVTIEFGSSGRVKSIEKVKS